MNDNTMYAFFWLCGAAVLLGIIAAIGINSYESTKSEERMIVEYGIDPIILDCADGGFSQDGAKFAFCMEAIRKYKISERDLLKLRKVIEDQ